MSDQYLNDRLTVDDIAHAQEKAMRAVLADPEVRRDFWQAGYEEFVKHASKNAASWVGKRIISSIGGALLAAGIYLGFKFGGWGK